MDEQLLAEARGKLDERLFAAWLEHRRQDDAFIADRLEQARLRGGRLSDPIHVSRERREASLETRRYPPNFSSAPVNGWRNAKAVESAYGSAFCDGHMQVLAELFERACENGIIFW